MAYLQFTVLLVLAVSCIHAEVLSGDQKATILATHNELRRMVNPTAADMLKLQWDDFLAGKADGWVAACKSGNDRFINQDSGKWKRLGQNNWYGTVEQLDADASVVVYEWVKRGTDYSFKNKNCPPTIPFNECADFTQVIMATTDSIGCAKNRCGDVYHVACFYGPGGNLFFKNPYQTGETCSLCPMGYTCEEKLCAKAAPEDPSQRELLEDILALLKNV